MLIIIPPNHDYARNILCREGYAPQVIEKLVLGLRPQVLDTDTDKEPEKAVKDCHDYSLAGAEIEAIDAAMLKCKDNISKAALLLGVERATLYAKIEKYKENDNVSGICSNL